LGREHALAGLVYAVGESTLVPSSRLYEALEDADIVVLGETHDNRDHHRLQASLLERFLERHPQAQVAFEMLDEDRADLLKREHFATPEQLAAAVSWSESGWPEFASYRPIFATALEREVQLVAAHPSAAHVRASMQGLPEDEARALQLTTPLPDDQLSAQREEISEAHCGHAPEAMVTAMQRAQAYKDAFMARALRQLKTPAVLIAGRGHARKDRGVPFFLQRAGATRVVSVAFIDLADARTAPGEYDLGAFDFAVFTPRVSDADPCEEFRQQLEHMRQARPAAATPLVAASGERLLVFAPHPDDEVLGAAGLTQRVLANGGSVETWFVTAGDGFEAAARALAGRSDVHAPDYSALGRARIAEAQRAADRLGVNRGDLHVLGFPDGELDALLTRHDSCETPLTAAHTGATHAPYVESRPASKYCGQQLRASLLGALRAFRPSLVVFSDPHDAHSDHAALGREVVRAVAAYQREQPNSRVRALGYLVHWTGWPPDSATPNAAQNQPLQLPAAASPEHQVCLTLSAHELARKAEALREHATQRAVIGTFLDSFVRQTECFLSVQASP
jgi:LmbE family N-acetylglucosaminyl deacetylase/uncharacterized iron-regulated protein